MEAAKEEWTEEQCKNIKKGMVSENSKEVYNTFNALTKTQQHKSSMTIVETSWRKAQLFETGGSAVSYTTADSIQTLVYLRITRPPRKRLKTQLCWGERLKRLCIVWKQERLQEWKTILWAA